MNTGVTMSVWPETQSVCVACRLILRCRQEARTRFAKMRSDVLVKMELLDNKHGKISKILSTIAQLKNYF